MIRYQGNDGGELAYDDLGSIRGLESEQIVSIIEFYSGVIEELKENNNTLPNARYTSDGKSADGPIEGIGYYTDCVSGEINYGTYYYPTKNTTTTFSEERIKNIKNRLKKAQAEYRRKNFISGIKETLKGKSK